MTDHDNVVALPGYSVPTPNEPRPAMVDELRRLLKLAEAGQILGLGVAAVIDDGTALPQVETMIDWQACQLRNVFYGTARLHRRVEKACDA